MNGILYAIILDGNYIGICENEYEGIEMAQNKLNGHDVLLDDDMPDRVWYEKIDVNRWYVYDAHNCSDKLSDDNIMCYDLEETEKCCEIMNKLCLQIERQEAKERAEKL